MFQQENKISQPPSPEFKKAVEVAQILDELDKVRAHALAVIKRHFADELGPERLGWLEQPGGFTKVQESLLEERA